MFDSGGKQCVTKFVNKNAQDFDWIGYVRTDNKFVMMILG